MNRLREIANEIEELDRQAAGNELYQQASKLYFESTMIQVRDIQESNSKVEKFLKEQKNIIESYKVENQELIIECVERQQLYECMFEFIQSQGLDDELRHYMAEATKPEKLH